MEKTGVDRKYQEFYQNLGRLFYAIAASDRVVRKEEVETLKQVVRDEWLDEDEGVDRFGTDSAFQIEIIFDWMDAHKPDAELAYQAFSDYYKEHQWLFTPRIKEKIIRTTRRIGSSFRDLNKSELILIARLETLFKN